MRDIIVFIAVFGLLPFVLKRPQIGIYAWSWLSYMNPHRMTWGLAYSFPFAQIVAICTLISIFAWREPKRFPVTALTVFWFLFLSWLVITTIFSAYPEMAWPKLLLVVKIQLIVILTVVVIRTKQELDILIWVITLSIGFFSIKGGIFTIVNLGAFRVWGPPESFIADNNHLAVASFMIVPLMYYLSGQSKIPAIKYGLWIGMMLTLVSAFGSQSRGALIAAFATAVYFWWNTPHKFIVGLVVIAVFAAVLGFMPETWWARMYTILDYQQDGSAMSRIAAWTMALNVANTEFFGMGFEFWGPEAYQMFSNNADHWDKNTAAHSIYFTILGEHGWIGFLLFFITYLVGWRTAAKTARQAKDIESLKWLNSLMKLLQVCLVSYASGGAFLNLAYYDLPWHILSFIVIGRVILEGHREGHTESINQPDSKDKRLSYGLSTRRVLSGGGGNA